MDVGSQDDLRERLEFEVSHREGRRFVFVLGSGMSAPLVPSTQEYMGRFKDLLGLPRSAGTSEGWTYMSLAQQVKLRRGAAALATVIRTGALEAFDGTPPVGGAPDATDSKWRITPQYEALGRFISRLPSELRGPLITTNFDPLAEVSLVRSGVPHYQVKNNSISGLVEPFQSGLVPVIKIHGDWASGPTLSTQAELERRRPEVDSALTELLAGSVVLVLGYGGWDDAFSRALKSVLAADPSNGLMMEILWAHYQSPSLTGLAADIRSDGRVSEYQYIATEVALDIAFPAAAYLWEIPTSGGLIATPSTAEVTQAPDSSLREFVDGVRPTYRTAAAAPRLEICRRLTETAERAMGEGIAGAVVLCGPTGEGKSVALLQTGIDLRSAHDDWIVLEYGIGAQDLSQATLESVRPADKPLCILVDEADLKIEEISRLIRAWSASDASRPLLFLLTLHSHYLARVRSSLERLTNVTVIATSGLPDDDAHSIAGFWKDHDLLPGTYREASIERLADIVLADASGIEGENSLFGSLLHLWSGDELLDRVDDLLIRLEKSTVGDVTYRSIFESICLVHSAWMSEEDRFLQGMPIEAVALYCGLQTAQVARLVLEPLGREVGLSKVGDNVFVRHPAIARAVIDGMDDTRLTELAGAIGEVGGRLRMEAKWATPLSKAITSLGRRLDGNAGIAAARGTLKTAHLLETRVSYLAALRDGRRSDTAAKYARAVEMHYREFPDWRSTLRGFYVEWSLNEFAEGEIPTSIRLLFVSISDSLNCEMTPRQAAYAIDAMVRAATKLRRQDATVEEFLRASERARDTMRGSSTDTPARVILADLRRSASKYTKLSIPGDYLRALKIIADENSGSRGDLFR